MIAPLILAAVLGLQDTTRLSLADAVRRALVSQPGVAAARDNQAAAAASVGEARAPLFPRLAVGFSATQYKIGNLVYPLSGISFTNLPLFNSTLSQASLSLGYTLFDFGGRTSQLRLAQAQERKADAALDAASAALVSRVANAYLRVLTTQGVLQAQEQELAALEAESRRIAQVEAQGKAAHVEVLQLAAQASRARADEVGTRAQLDVAERDLAQLVALPVETVRAELGPVQLADTAVADRAALVATAEQNSPDVAQARRSAEAAAAGAGVARATLLPQLQLTAAYVENGHTFTGYRPWWNAGLQLSYPIFTGGSRGSAIKRTEADARAAGEQLRAAQQAAELSVDGALATVTAARATVDALVTAVAQSAEVERIRLLSVQVGSGTETDYLDAEATLLSNRAALVQARHAEIAARIELARVTGVLTPEWLTRMVSQ
ncbi:MAG TPA: TolC family protein [Gemmatimonadales bacterium]|nr:TolC family protein [Gemmatimonadales bacterium]